MKPQIQFINVELEELVQLINKGVKTCFNELSSVQQPIEQKQENELLTRSEIASLFYISNTTVSEWTKNGTLKVYKMGRRNYYKRTEVMQTLFNSNVA